MSKKSPHFDENTKKQVFHFTDNNHEIRILLLGLAALLPFSTASWGTLANALKTGNPVALSDVSESNIISAALSQISGYQAKHNQMLKGIYNTEAISYRPGNRGSAH